MLLVMVASSLLDAELHGRLGPAPPDGGARKPQSGRQYGTSGWLQDATLLWLLYACCSAAALCLQPILPTSGLWRLPAPEMNAKQH